MAGSPIFTRWLVMPLAAWLLAGGWVGGAAIAQFDRDARRKAFGNPEDDERVQEHLAAFQKATEAMEEAKAAHEEAKKALKDLYTEMRLAKSQEKKTDTANPIAAAKAMMASGKAPKDVTAAFKQLEAAKVLATGALSKDPKYVAALKAKADAQERVEEMKAQGIQGPEIAQAIQVSFKAATAVRKLEDAIIEKDSLVQRAEKNLAAAVARAIEAQNAAEGKKGEEPKPAAGFKLTSSLDDRPKADGDGKPGDEAKPAGKASDKPDGKPGVEAPAKDDWPARTRIAQAEVSSTRKAYMDAVRELSVARAAGEKAFREAVQDKADARKAMEERAREFFERAGRRGWGKGKRGKGR